MNARKSESGGGTPTARRNVAANISYITGRVWTGGDLPCDLGEEAMLADLVAIRRAGITDILDDRIECSDAEFIAAHAPDMYYLWNGQDDAGQAMPDQWFFDGVDFALTAIRAARPIAAISYAGDALSWWHRMTETPASLARRQRAEVATWHRRNPLDVVRIIRTIRSHEDANHRLPA